MLPISLREEQIARQMSSRIYSRALELYRKGAVENLVLRGRRLNAQVQGFHEPFYTVTIDFSISKACAKQLVPARVITAIGASISARCCLPAFVRPKKSFRCPLSRRFSNRWMRRRCGACCLSWRRKTPKSLTALR